MTKCTLKRTKWISRLSCINQTIRSKLFQRFYRAIWKYCLCSHCSWRDDECQVIYFPHQLSDISWWHCGFAFVFPLFFHFCYVLLVVCSSWLPLHFGKKFWKTGFNNGKLHLAQDATCCLFLFPSKEKGKGQAQQMEMGRDGKGKSGRVLVKEAWINEMR